VKGHSDSRGVMVEVDYRPLAHGDVAEPALQEFCQLLQSIANGSDGSLEVVPAPFSGFNLPQKFGLQHAALQYAALLTVLVR